MTGFIFPFPPLMNFLLLLLVFQTGGLPKVCMFCSFLDFHRNVHYDDTRAPYGGSPKQSTSNQSK